MFFGVVVVVCVCGWVGWGGGGTAIASYGFLELIQTDAPLWETVRLIHVRFI